MGLEALNDMTVSDIEKTSIGDIMAACGYTDDSVNPIDSEHNFRDAVRDSTVVNEASRRALATNLTSVGGRRGKKGGTLLYGPWGGRGTKKRKEPAVLASWRKFVRKVQHEENISYPKAMKRASKRKSEWQKGGAVEAFDPAADKYESATMNGGDSAANAANANHSDSKLKPMIAGKSRRKRGGTKKRRMSRRR
jgi:hypothetical protein